MTDEQTAKAIELLTERMNRVEAVVAHNKPVEQPDTAKPTIEYAIELLDRAVKLYGQQSESYQAMMMDVRRAR